MEIFKRENRYLVAKRKDVIAALSIDEQIQLDRLIHKVDDYRQANDKAPLECAVIENDWPEYEPVWQMVKERVQGQYFSNYGDSEANMAADLAEFETD